MHRNFALTRNKSFDTVEMQIFKRKFSVRWQPWSRTHLFPFARDVSRSRCKTTKETTDFISETHSTGQALNADLTTECASSQHPLSALTSDAEHTSRPEPVTERRRSPVPLDARNKRERRRKLGGEAMLSSGPTQGR